MNSERPIVIFVIGGPGSGKGTQCKLLAKDFGMIHLSIGDILRELRNKDTEEGRKVNEYMIEYEKNGRLMPSNYIMKIIKLTMEEAGWNKQVYLLDGFIKTMDMVREWDKELGGVVELRRVIWYECPRSVMEERLINRGKTESRGDDSEKIIRKRINMYEDLTKKVLDEYRNRGIVTVIHSDDSIQEVFVESKCALKLAMGWY